MQGTVSDQLHYSTVVTVELHNHQVSGIAYETEMDAKDCVVVCLLLFSLGVIGCMWNKQSQLASKLDDQQSQLHDLRNQLFKLHSMTECSF